MSKPDLSTSMLLEIAKQTLGISVNSRDAIPSGYLGELRRHIKLSKDDTLFRVYPHRGYGFGLVECLENGCENVMVKLGQRTSSNDGGANEGIGMKSHAVVAYMQHHVQEHPTHKANRLARVKAEANSLMSGGISSITYPPLYNHSILDTAKESHRHATGNLYLPQSGANSSDSIISMKRSYSDVDTEITVPSSSPHKSPRVFKKPKVEPVDAIPSHPLAAVDRNSSIPARVGTGGPSSASLTPDAARSLLEQTNASIDTVRTLLTHFQEKSKKSAHDKQRIFELEKQLHEHLATRTCYDLALHSLYTTVNDGVDSVEVVPRTIPPINPGALPMVPGLQPNYGDTMDHESDDSIHIVRQRNGFAMRGPIASPEDFDVFLVEAGNSFAGNESVDNALAKLGLKKLGEQLPLMSISLMPHQVIGVAWMLEHERGSHKGGILADEMGLGKTVQMISTIAKHQSNDPAVKSTLICAPVALLDQWKLEIETKTDSCLSCLIYHGPNKPKLLKDLQKFDVVLTTFQTLALEWPDQNAAEKKKKRKRDQDSDFIESNGEKEKVGKKGLLLRMKWFRFVLDEAQNIRNRNTRVSNAVTFVDATYRWCLTGTPVTNSLTDCYAFMRFLQIRPWYDWNDFNTHISKLERRRPDLASSRLQAILNSCLIRRKKDSVLDGKKLIELPPKDVVLRKLTFSQDERDIYNLIEKQSQAIINKYLRAGTILKNYSHVLVLLLRLRQLCSHPSLIQEGGNAFIIPDEAGVNHEVQTELDRAAILAGGQFVTAMKAKFRAIACEPLAGEKASDEATIDEEECPICFDTLTDPVVTRCCHVFCAECIDTVLKQSPIEDGKKPRYAMSERPCPSCREPIQKEMVFQRKAFEPTDTDLSGTHPGSSIIVGDDDDDGQPVGTEVLTVTAKKPKGKGKVKKLFTKRMQESDEDYDESDDSLSDFIMETDEDGEEKDARREFKKKLAKNKRIVLDSDEDIHMSDEVELLPPKVVRKKGKTVQSFLPSTKMKEMMVLLKEWAEAEETKNEKTMVLSQWTSCLDLVADYLEENGFTFVRYQGDMSRLARDEAVRMFMCQGKARIMLMSLKCGGVGLNLTRANRVISLDLGWSLAVENQAFDRVHRLGQVRPVTVQRLVIEDTVETRILALQERKQNLADGSLGEGTGKKLGRLTVKDLANLFGLNTQGHRL